VDGERVWAHDVWRQPLHREAPQAQVRGKQEEGVLQRGGGGLTAYMLPGLMHSANCTRHL